MGHLEMKILLLGLSFKNPKFAFEIKKRGGLVMMEKQNENTSFTTISVGIPIFQDPSFCQQSQTWKTYF